MTMPHLMNCMHKEDGWCLECVGELNVEAERGRRVKTTPDELAVMKVLLSWFPNMTEESQEHFAIQYRTRAYHGFGHLSFMLKFLRDNSELCTDYVNAVGGMGPIVFAILFHDLVYEPGSKHNEATSALDFRTHAFVHGIDKKIVEMVEYAITNSMQAPQHKIEYPDTELGRKEWTMSRICQENAIYRHNLRKGLLKNYSKKSLKSIILQMIKNRRNISPWMRSIKNIK